MSDQYIYSRADGKRKNCSMSKHIGFGLMYYTDGIVPIQAGINKISYYVNKTKNSHGKSWEIISKRNIPLCEGKTALFMSKNIEPEKERPFLHCHGYVFDTTEDIAVNPDVWMYQEYIRTNVNELEVAQEQGDLKDKSIDLWPLSQLLEITNYSLEQFISMVGNGISALNQNTSVFIELDFTQDRIEEIMAQMIRWIYHMLPYSVRRQAGFTTCFDDNCISGEFTYVFIPAALILLRGNRIVINSRKQPNRISYVYAKGQFIHSVMTPELEFDTWDGIYSKWLKQQIENMISMDAMSVLSGIHRMKSIYQYMDQLLEALPEQQQISISYLDAAYWTHIICMKYNEQEISADLDIPFSDQQKKKYAEKAVDFIHGKSGEDAQSVVYDSLMKECKQGYSDGWVHIVCKISKVVEPELKDFNLVLLAVFLAKKLNESDNYLESYMEFVQLCENTYDSKDLHIILQYVIFYFEKWHDLLEDCDLTSDEDAFEQKRIQITKELISVHSCCTKLVQGIKSGLEIFSDFEPDNAKYMMDLMHFEVNKIFNVPQFKPRFEDFGEICQMHQVVKEKYPDYENNIYVIFHQIENEVIKKCWGKMLEQSLIDTVNELNRQMSMTTRGEIVDGWWFRLLKSVFCFIAKFNNVNDLGKLFKSELNLYQWAVECIAHVRRIIQEGKQTDIQKNEEMVRGFFTNICICLMENQEYKILDPDWYRHLDESLPCSKEELLHNTSNIGLVGMVVLNNYLKQPEYSFQNLDNAIAYVVDSFKLSFVSLAAVKDIVLDILDQMYAEGTCSEIGCDVLEYIYLYKYKNDLPHEEYYREMIYKNGGQSFIDLLNMYPSAPKLQEADSKASKRIGLVSKFASKFMDSDEDEYEERVGRYGWMKTDKDLVKAIFRLVTMEGFFNDTLKEDEMFAPNLIAAVDLMLPKESVYGDLAGEIKISIYRYSKESEYFTNETNKAMRKLKRDGII